jgi:hypothetical protein
MRRRALPPLHAAVSCILKLVVSYCHGRWYAGGADKIYGAWLEACGCSREGKLCMHVRLFGPSQLVSEAAHAKA